ncbi:MAG: hypothetical protein M3M88_01830 [Thermoproteota archaeon]|nr:hypothetical protein [Thermoproteota archaeon]
MSKFLPIKSEIPMELANLAQKIKYHEYTKCQEIVINALDNITSKGLILFGDSFMGLEERIDKSNKCSNSFPILDLGI